MRNVRLTPAFIAKPTVPEGIHWDAKQRSFGFRVKDGHRSFVVFYRDRGGHSHLMTIPLVLGLEKARKRARVLLGQVGEGRDPLGERRKEKDAQQNTLRAISEEYFARKGKHLRSAYEWRRNLERAVFPVLGSFPISEIRRSDIARLQDKIEDERGAAAADTAFAILRGIMSWHSARTDDFRSPIVRGMSRRRSRENARARILNDDEIRTVWATATAMPGPFGALVKFLLLTSARRNEAARMVWPEVEGTDWTLPASRNKTKQDLCRPLSKAAQAVLAELPRFASSPFVFTIGGRTPLRNFDKPKKALDVLSGVTGYTLHDLRRTSRSLLSRAGIHPDISERCLGHAIGGMRGVYDRHDFAPEMAHAFEALAAQIERIINPQENVVAMARR
jgi:integrase